MQDTSKVRRIAVAVAATFLLTGLPGPWAGAQTVGQLRTGENYRLGNEPGTRGRDTPSLAANPADPRHVVETEVDVLRGKCDYNVSFDGGASWTGGTLTAPPPFPSPDAGYPDPLCDGIASAAMDEGSLKFGPGQTVYAAFASRPNDQTGFSALVARSTDGGRTFATAVVAMRGGPAASPSYARPEIAVVGSTVYVAAAATLPGATAGTTTPRTVVARSTDGGATWSAPVDAGGAPAIEASEPVVGPDGAVYVAWRQSANVPAGFVVMSKSVDGGQTWTRANMAPVRGYGPDIAGSTFNASSFPRIAVDPGNGNLYATYMQGPPHPTARQDHFIHPDVDVLLVRSTDGGATWSTPFRVNDDPLGAGRPGEGPAQRHPNVAVAPDGRVDVVWQDRRHGYRSPTNSHLGNGEARLGDTYYAYSTDGGLTFSRPNRRISDKSQNLDVGLDYRAGVYWNYGPALAHLGNDEVLFAWQDSREGNTHTETEDIYLARVNVRSPAGPVPVRRLPEATAPGLSVAVSQLGYQAGPENVLNVGFTATQASRVVVVNQDDPAAAMAGAVLARANYGPVLLSPPSRLPADARAEVGRMDAVGAFVVGGLAAGVVNDLAAVGVPRDRIVRLSGGSPAELARAVAQAMDFRSGADRDARRPAFDSAVIANPASAEAATAAALAATRRLPYLFVDRDAVPAATAEALSSLGITNTLVVGGPGAVSEGVASRLPAPRRLGGGDVQATSEAVLVESRARGLPLNMAYVADAARPADAAILGAAVARIGGLLVSVPGAEPGAAEDSLQRVGLRTEVDRLVVARSLGAAPLGLGYRLVASDGGIFSFGGAPFFGSTGNRRLNRPVVGMAATPSDNGYWLVASDGGIFSFGDARFFGSTGNIRLNQPVVAMAPTPSGDGYWLVASDGGIFAFGDARFFGSTGNIRLNRPVVGMASTPSGDGYWLVASDGGLFAFGDARFFGSTGNIRLNQPVVGMASSPSGSGYRLVASDGGIFSFGDARFFGSTGNIRLNRPVVGMASTPSGNGYWLVASDGGIFAFGDAPFLGSTGSIRLNQPVVGMAAG